MATSSTVAFNPSVSQCIEEAYERCNVQLTSGLSLRTALFSLNILLRMGKQRNSFLGNSKYKSLFNRITTCL